MRVKTIGRVLAMTLGTVTPAAASADDTSAAPAAADADLSRLEGDWAGKLDAGAFKLRLVLHVHTNAGTTAATMDSPDQNANGLPATVTLDGGHVRISAQGAAGSFDGQLTADGAGLVGQWSGAPTTFTRQAIGPTAAPVRPQIPAKPYPYREETVTYPGGTAPVHISGTLTIPQGVGPFPAVLLIAGSGPQARDETVFGHPIFLVLADCLTRHGIAVLRYDKRGIGQSTGDLAAATSKDFAADAEAGVAYLKNRPEIDARRIGLIGHSEGGIIAPMVAETDPSVAFVVLMAGPGVRGDEITMAQARAITGAGGASESAIAVGAALERRFLDAVLSAKDQHSAELAVRDVLRGAGLPQTAIDAQAKAASSDWYRFFLGYDPAPALRRLRLPVLAIIGSKDLQVTADQNLPALREALKDDPDAKVLELPGLNHLFQTAKTGAPSEYGDIEETMSPTALELIANWIGERVGGSRSLAK
jgi:pimeloyl-ACP methyl ester carboxylesterase